MGDRDQPGSPGAYRASPQGIASCAGGGCDAGLISALVIFPGLFSLGSREPVRSFRHRNLEPGAFARNAVLGDRDAGDRQDLTGKG